MLRRTLLFAAITVLCFLVFFFTTPWTQDAFALAPEQAARLTSWMTYDTIAEDTSDTSALNWTKVATMIETRDSPMLIPILQSWLANVPNDWPFVIWTGEENHEILSRAVCFQDEIKTGRLNFTRIDTPGSIYRPDPARTSTLSDLLANTNWFWTQFHPSADWMIFFQIDSVLCSKSGQSVDDWLGYEFVGGPSPWSHGPNMDRLGGNGGLSMRRISALRQITTETPRQPGQDPEDVWFTRRLRDKPDTRWPEREGRPTYRFSMSQGWLEDATVDEAWSPLGLHHGSGHLGDLLEPDGAGRITNKLHRILRSCPDFLFLRYALDEYRDVKWDLFNATQGRPATPTPQHKSPNAAAGMEDITPSPEMQASIEDLKGNLHDLTPLLTELVNAGRLNQSNTTTEMTEKEHPHFSTSSDDVVGRDTA